MSNINITCGHVVLIFEQFVLSALCNACLHLRLVWFAGGHQVPQHMMPPPAMYPGSGNPGKMYPSGMMMHPGGNVGMPSSSGMYAGQQYGGQPHPGWTSMSVCRQEMSA